MKLSYKPVGGGGYTPLCDETTGATPLEEFSPANSAQVQEEQLAMSSAQFRAARGNVRAQFQVAYNQQYASRDLALAGTRVTKDFFMAYGAKFHLQVIEGVETHYYPNAVVADYRPKLVGVSVQHTLTFVADAATQTPPL